MLPQSSCSSTGKRIWWIHGLVSRPVCVSVGREGGRGRWGGGGEGSRQLEYYIRYFNTENKEGQLKSEDLGKDIASVQALLSKHVSNAWPGCITHDWHDDNVGDFRVRLGCLWARRDQQSDLHERSVGQWQTSSGKNHQRQTRKCHQKVVLPYRGNFGGVKYSPANIRGLSIHGLDWIQWRFNLTKILLYTSFIHIHYTVGRY